MSISVQRQSQESYAILFKERLAELWFNQTDTKHLIHVGPTCSGKTYHAIQRLKLATNGIYLAPLRLLAWEIQDKLIEDGFPCNLLTGEEQIVSDNCNYTSATIEMMDYHTEYEVVVIDEAWMVGDPDRGKSWLKAILTAKAKEIHIICNEEALELLTKILWITNREYEVKRYESLQKINISDSRFILSKNIPDKGVFVTFSRINVLINKMKFENLGKNVSILYGNLPPEVKKKQINDFITGKTDIMVSTDVIGMGINVPCNYIVFLDIEKYDGKTNRKLTPIEIRQIAGRTGRYGLSSENCFVSAINDAYLDYIRTNYFKLQKISLAHLGFDYDMFSSLPPGMGLSGKILRFKNGPFIPDELRDYVVKEDIGKYMDISYIINDKKFSLMEKWGFLTAPVKPNNKDYFNNLVHKYEKSKELPLPLSVNINLETKTLEDKISEIELYLNLTRHFNYNQDDKEKVSELKITLIDKLTSILLDKKLSSKKKCKTCDELLNIDYPYPYCNLCYQNMRSNYYDF